MSGHIVCVGIVTLDQVFEVPAIPPAGKVVVSGLKTNAGGMAATAAAAIAALGGRADFWGRLGRDEVGNRLVTALEQAGVDAGGVLRCPSGQSPTSAVLRTPDGERLLAAYPGGPFTVSPADLPLATLDAGMVVLADVRWIDAAMLAFSAARRLGLPTVLDADVGDPAQIARLGGLCDHAIFSQPGLAQFACTEDAASGLAIAARTFGGIVAVTLGAEGVRWLEDGTEHHLAAPRITPLDTTGAGDVFHGAYALALVERRSVADAFAFASAAAAAKCLNGTGWAALPDRAQADRLMNSTHGVRNG